MQATFSISRRVLIFLVTAFALTWAAWGSLILLARMQVTSYGQWPYMTIYVLGGLGPTIAAYVAVCLTSAQAPLREFHQRLLRWRVPIVWYPVAIGLPIVLALAAVGIAAALRPALIAAVAIKPWTLFLSLFPMMMVGGGVEEFGWRGIAQEEWGRSMGQGRAALLIGPVWAIWHLPLFFLPGVAQFGGNFALFLLGIMGNALILGWLYSRTRSILLCIFFHASWNAMMALGVTIPHGHGMSLVGPCLGLAVGALLFLAGGPKQEHAAATRAETSL